MNDLCPNCRVPRELRMKRRTVRENVGGEQRKVLIKSYFCSVCGISVRSEEIPLSETLAEDAG